MDTSYDWVWRGAPDVLYECLFVCQLAMGVTVSHGERQGMSVKRT